MGYVRDESVAYDYNTTLNVQIVGLHAPFV
jgi:hypothetical protein